MYKVKVISHLFTNIRGNIRLATTLADTLYNFYLNKFGIFYCVHRNKPDWWMFHANFSYLMKQFVLEVLSMSLIDMYIMLHSYNDDKLMINSYNKVFKKVGQEWPIILCWCLHLLRTSSTRSIVIYPFFLNCLKKLLCRTSFFQKSLTKIASLFVIHVGVSGDLNKGVLFLSMLIYRNFF